MTTTIHRVVIVVCALLPALLVALAVDVHRPAGLFALLGAASAGLGIAHAAWGIVRGWAMTVPTAGTPREPPRGAPPVTPRSGSAPRRPCSPRISGRDIQADARAGLVAILAERAEREDPDLLMTALTVGSGALSVGVTSEELHRACEERRRAGA